VQESLLVTLYARAVDSRKRRPILKDTKAAEMVQSIDWDFRRFHQRRRIVGASLRSAIFDEWVKDFLHRHPAGTVVEIGSGLNTRFERLDNGTVHWFDMDLPDVVELRRKFFADSGRRVNLAASILSSGWVNAVHRSPGPYCFVAEGVFLYLTEEQVKAALAQIAGSFPRASIAFDTGNRKAMDHQNKDHARLKFGARMSWACEDPKEIEHWNIGLRLIESCTLRNIPEPVSSRLPLGMRISFRVFGRLFPKFAQAYRLSLFQAADC
jgi:O-methyltransferase involved in polyketide biosynthesis